jgi:protein-disulfide isomerase
MIRIAILLIFAVIVAAAVQAQNTGTVLATTSVKNFTIDDLPAETRKIWNDRAASIAEARTQLVSQMLTELLIQTEARAAGVTPEILIATEKTKVADPTDVQIQAVFDANRDALADRPPAEARKQIIKFLRQDPEQAAIRKFTDSLAAKYNVVNGKDINSPGLQPTDVIFKLNAKPVTAKEFEEKYKLTLFDLQDEIYDQVKRDLDGAIYSALVAEEARQQSVDAPTLIGREITDKLRDFSDEERLSLQDAFVKRLYAKYKVNIIFEGPKPIVQNISTDDDPSRGPASAPVTVVMFSDFQCPACAATHPVLKKVLAEYGDKIRFVVRDFPLTSIHENAFQAAKAASAANAQGKFFDYIELLYTHQDALDPASLKKYAADLGLNAKQFELDLSSEKTAAEIQKDIVDGRSYGIYGTPSIFVNGINVRRLSADGFREAINSALGK